MEQLGRMVTCDRCGKQVFRKRIGEEEGDGGYTRWDKFEPLDDGWERWLDINQTLCPECSEEYLRLINNFKERRQDKNEEH